MRDSTMLAYQVCVAAAAAVSGWTASDISEMLSFAIVRCAIVDGRLSHARASRFGAPTIEAYGVAASSPTGVQLMASLPDSPATMEWLRALRAGSPLSPTEAR